MFFKNSVLYLYNIQKIKYSYIYIILLDRYSDLVSQEGSGLLLLFYGCINRFRNFKWFIKRFSWSLSQKKIKVFGFIYLFFDKFFVYLLKEIIFFLVSGLNGYNKLGVLIFLQFGLEFDLWFLYESIVGY